MARVLMLLSVIFVSIYVTEQAYFLQQDYIDSINEQATTWKAGVNFHPDTPEEDLIKLLGSTGVQTKNKNNNYMYKSKDPNYAKLEGKIPKHFDARKQWRHCWTIGAVRDQGNCGSCWAVSTSSAFADRLCVATDAKFNDLLSIEEVAFCLFKDGYGCGGGSSIRAWEFFSEHGLVTGGDYDSGEGCQPYRVPPCPNNANDNSTCAGKPREHNHICRRHCYGDVDIDFKSDHRYTHDYYYLTYDTIQQDVMTYGPVEASFNVFSDFYSYKSGVYARTENSTELLGAHSVKLIGWGEENGVPYWLMVNSWNQDWGDHGLFKIRRGTNECNVENSPSGGVPAT